MRERPKCILFERLLTLGVGKLGIAGVGDNRHGFKALWRDEAGISSVEYAMLLAMIAGGIVMAADMLSNAVSNQMTDTAALFDDDGCSNDGSGDGTGGDDGSGQGGANTC